MFDKYHGFLQKYKIKLKIILIPDMLLWIVADNMFYRKALSQGIPWKLSMVSPVM